MVEPFNPVDLAFNAAAHRLDTLLLENEFRNIGKPEAEHTGWTSNYLVREVIKAYNDAMAPTICTDCDGAGVIMDGKNIFTCGTCEGRGFIKKEST